jgi:glutamate--cysteine ligase
VLRTKGDDYYDFVVLNNDLINGVPDALKKLRSPIYPSVAAGWHSRVKSHHFTEVNALMHRLADQFDFDPFFVTTAFESISDVDVFLESDRARLKDRAELMFDRLTMAYKLHEIDQKPLVFLKANKGTYGMGVVALESAQEILDFNRRLKNKLTEGKEGHEMCEFILQEGVPSSLLVNQQVAELCFYFSSHDYLGGFYRLNSQKSDRDNLNSRGMSFQTFSDSNSSADSRFMKEVLFYQFLGWVSVNAAHQEIRVLEDALR